MKSLVLLHVVIVSTLLLACNGRISAVGDDEASSSDTSESSDTGEDDTTETGEEPDCPLAPLETIDIEALIGEETVVQEVEALGGGEVVVAGYFGMMRRPAEGGDFELLDELPDVVSSSFVRLTRGIEPRELWVAAAFGTVAHTLDAGDTWETFEYEHDVIVHMLANGRVLLAGDALVGAPVGDSPSWFEVDVLDGDVDGFSENNLILGVTVRGERTLAVERFGRMAFAGALEGPWTQIDAPLTFDAELLDLQDLGLLLLSSDGEVYHSANDGLAWTNHGTADGWPDVAASATQLGFRASDQVVFAAGDEGIQVSCDLGETWATIALDTESTVIYDVSIARDGSAWFAGFNHVHRIAAE